MGFQKLDQRQDVGNFKIRKVIMQIRLKHMWYLWDSLANKLYKLISKSPKFILNFLEKYAPHSLFNRKVL